MLFGRHKCPHDAHQGFVESEVRGVGGAYGRDAIGLLTGDTSINGEAPVVVAEVLRNMLYAGSTTLDNLSHVVMDEVHYWRIDLVGVEEIAIHLPSER